MKSKELFSGILIGIVVGIGIGFLIGDHLNHYERYSISVLNESNAIKINKQTGKTWIISAGTGLVWEPVKESNPETVK